MPLLLDVSSRIVHIEFLLDLGCLSISCLLVLELSGLPIFFLLLALGSELSGIMSGLLLHALDLLLLLHKLSDLLLLQSVSLVSMLLHNALLLLDEFLDLVAHNGLVDKGFPHMVDVLFLLMLNPEILPLHAKERSFDLPLLVLPLQLRVSLGFIHRLLEPDNLLLALLGLLGELILLFLVLLIDLLDLSVELTVFLLKDVKL